jgi:hypothetical protein
LDPPILEAVLTRDHLKARSANGLPLRSLLNATTNLLSRVVNISTTTTTTITTTTTTTTTITTITITASPTSQN